VKESKAGSRPESREGAADADLMNAAEDGLRMGLERWHEVCPCCFSEAYPGGLEQAVGKLKG